jgi:hypothetical protein
MKNKTLMTGAIALVAAAMAVTTFADVRPDPDTVHIKRLAYAGSGCPPGSAVADLAPDRTAFTLMFSEFIAELGPGVPAREARKNCQVNLSLHVPHGFTYGIASVDYRGYGIIERGTVGRQQATYYFQGQAPDATAWEDMWGPFDDIWHVRHEVEYASIVWAPCGVERSLNINAQLRVEHRSGPRTSKAIMGMDSEDGNLHQIFHVVWAECRR